MDQKNYKAIDGLRAYSAIGILLMHVLSNGKYKVEGFIFQELIPSFANLVFLFMIISAFGMCCGYYDKIINNKINLEDFYKKRYIKIWPYFAVLCLLDFIISPSLNSIYEIIANLTLCFGLLPDANITVIGVGWFLGVVFAFYMMFPYFCYLISSKERAWFSFVVALIFNGLCTVYFKAGRGNIVYSAVFFFAGGLIYLYRENIENLSRKYHLGIAIICMTGSIGYYVLGASVPMMLVLYSALLVFAMGVQRKGILQNLATSFLSSISMEIYLSHMVIYRVIEKLRMLHLFKVDKASYVFVVVGTIIGTIVFAVVLKKILLWLDSLLTMIRRKMKVRVYRWLKRN